MNLAVLYLILSLSIDKAQSIQSNILLPRTPSKTERKPSQTLRSKQTPKSDKFRRGKITKPGDNTLSGVAPSPAVRRAKTQTLRFQKLPQPDPVDRNGQPLSTSNGRQTRRNPSRYIATASYDVHGPAEAKVVSHENVHNDGWDDLNNQIVAAGRKKADSVTSPKLARAQIMNPRTGFARATAPRVEVMAFPEPGGTVTITADGHGYQQFRHIYPHPGQLASTFARHFRSSTPGLPITVKAHVQGPGMATVQGLTPAHSGYNGDDHPIINMQRG